MSTRKSTKSSSQPTGTRTAGSSSASSRKKRKKRSRAGKFTAIIISCFLVLFAAMLIGGSSYIWHLLGKIDVTSGTGSGGMINNSLPDDFNDDTPYGDGPDVVFDPNPYKNATRVDQIPVMGDTREVTNILLIGIDGRDNYSARSDSNIILSINNKHKTIKMISLMRDTCVLIPGFDVDGDGKDDYAKLNTAYALGGYQNGPERLFQTIETNFRLKIDKYIGVNFVVFPIAVDHFGGIDIELTGPEATQIPKKGTTATVETGDPNFVPLSNQPGNYHLDGFQTLQYARIRHVGNSDFGRVQRQQKVLNILIDKAKTTNPLTLINVLDDLLPQVKTNMSRTQLLDYITYLPAYSQYTVKTSYRVPQDGEFEDGWLRKSQVLRLTDPKQCVTDLHTYIYSDE